MTRNNRKARQARNGMATAVLSTNQQQVLISADMTAPIQAACQLHTHDKENTSGHLIQNGTEGSDNKEKDEAASGAANLPRLMRRKINEA